MGSVPSYNFSWYGGNTEFIDIKMKNEDYSIQELSGAKAELGLKLNRDDTDLTYYSEIPITSIIDGEFIFKITDTTTTNLLPIGKQRISYYYAIDITEENGNISTVLEGKITISRNALS